MERYEGKRAVIIGGTSGIGLATAKMLLDGGARVLVTGRSQAGLDLAQTEIGEDALVVSSDARSLTDIDALATTVKNEFDSVDLLFVNAGLGLFSPLADTTEETFDEASGEFLASFRVSGDMCGASRSEPPRRKVTDDAITSL